MLLINDYSRMTWVIFLKEKYEAFERFKVFNSMVENTVDTKIKCLRYNRGLEFTSNEFDDFYENIKLEDIFFAPRTPQQNGIVERKNRIVLRWL